VHCTGTEAGSVARMKTALNHYPEIARGRTLWANPGEIMGRYQGCLLRHLRNGGQQFPARNRLTIRGTY
jgi:hypothetical protein